MLYVQANVVLPSLDRAEKAPCFAGHRQDGPRSLRPSSWTSTCGALPRPAYARGREVDQWLFGQELKTTAWITQYTIHKVSSLALVTVDLRNSLTTPQQRAVTRKLVSAAGGGRVQRSAVRHSHTPAVNLRSLISTPAARERPFPPITKSLLVSHVGAILTWVDRLGRG